MKPLHRILAFTAVLATMSVSSHAAVTITGQDLPNGTEMLGSSTDYSFLGNGAQFPAITNYGGGSPDIGVQTDFTLSPDVNEAYGGDGRYSIIKNPLGVSTQTGILFGRAGAVNQSVLDLTLGTGSPTFDYGDFDLYVMFGNDIGDGIHNTFISVEDMTAGTPVYELPVIDANTNFSAAAFAEFNIVGASAGDTLRIGTTSTPGGLNYLGGVALEVPEPSTYALLIGGFALLGVFAFRHRRAGLV